MPRLLRYRYFSQVNDLDAQIGQATDQTIFSKVTRQPFGSQFQAARIGGEIEYFKMLPRFSHRT